MRGMPYKRRGRIPAASKALAYQVRRLREARGWSQEACAEAADLHPRVVVSIEAASIDPRLSTVVSLADAFDTTLSKLIARPRRGTAKKTER